MKVHQDVKFHHNLKASHKNRTFSSSDYNPSSHELDANAMRNILALLTKKTNEMKNKQKENPYHRYEGVYRESDNIDKPPSMEKEFDPRDLFDLMDPKRPSHEANENKYRKMAKSNERDSKISDSNIQNKYRKLTKSNERDSKIFNGDSKISKGSKISNDDSTISKGSKISNDDSKISNDDLLKLTASNGTFKFTSNNTLKLRTSSDTFKNNGEKNVNLTKNELQSNNSKSERKEKENFEESDPTSAEVFGEVMRKIVSQGEKGKKLFQQLLSEIDDEELKQRLMVKLKNTTKIEEEIKRRKRDFILSSPLRDELNRNDEDDDAAIEEVTLISFLLKTLIKNFKVNLLLLRLFKKI